MHAWVPSRFPDVDIPGCHVHVYDDIAEAADNPTIGFFVPPYMGPVEQLKTLATLPNLQVCQLLTAGFEQVRPYIPAGVTVCNAAGVHDASTAELALGLIIASQRGIDIFARNMPTGIWGHQPYPSLADRHVLIIGAGGLGNAIARRVRACDAEVTLVARVARNGVAGLAELHALVPAADIVVLAVPLTPQTKGMVNAEFLAQMAPGALLVNMSRGPVVRTEALTRAVAEGRIRAALDVTDPEPLPVDHPLWQLPGVLISPHVGGNSTAFDPRALRLLTDQIGRWHRGEPLANIVLDGTDTLTP
jgi:phosphoglycerate dehydrogenase-like enzyme